MVNEIPEPDDTLTEHMEHLTIRPENHMNIQTAKFSDSNLTLTKKEKTNTPVKALAAQKKEKPRGVKNSEVENDKKVIELGTVGFEWPQIVILLICILAIAGVGVLLCMCLGQEAEKEAEYERDR